MKKILILPFLLFLFCLILPTTPSMRIQIKNQMLASDFNSAFNENSYLASTNLGKVLASLMKNSEIQIRLSYFFTILQEIQSEVIAQKQQLVKESEFGQLVHDSVIDILQKTNEESEKQIKEFEENKFFDAQIKDKSHNDEVNSIGNNIDKYNAQIDQLSYEISEKKASFIVDIEKNSLVLADIDYLLEILVGLEEEKNSNSQFLYMQMNALKLKRSKFNLTTKLPELNPPQQTETIANCFEELTPNSGYVKQDALFMFKKELLKLRDSIDKNHKKYKQSLSALEDSFEKNINRLKAEIVKNPHILKQIDQLKQDKLDFNAVLNEETERWMILEKLFQSFMTQANLNQETLKLCFSILNQQGIKTQSDAKIFE